MPGLRGRSGSVLGVITIAMGVALTIMMAMSLTSSVPALSLYPKPMMVINGSTYNVAYYRVPMGTPSLVIRGEFDGSSVPISVSLFVISAGRIYVVGYYSGRGSVTIDLVNPLLTGISNEWLSRYGDGIWPSLIAFVTYGEENRTWTAVVTVPYNPAWITNKEPVTITATAYLDKVKPMAIQPIKVNDEQAINTTPTVIMPPLGGGGGSTDYFGYQYVGSCLGNNALNNLIGMSCYANIECWYWVPQQCTELEGPIPLLFVGWSNNAIESSINYIDLGYFSGYVQSGSGLFGVLNFSGPQLSGYATPGLNIVGPAISFNKNYNVYIEYTSYAVSAISISYGLPGTKFVNGTLYYYVNSPGFVYLGLYGNISYVAFQEYQCQESIYGGCAGGGSPLNAWANGTVPLSISPSEISGSVLFVYPGLDTGSGPITGMFAGVLYDLYKYHQLPISLMDAYAYPSGDKCSNAPPVSSVGSDEIGFTISSVTSAYSPNPIAWIYQAGSLMGGIFLDYAPEWLSLSANSISTVLGTFLPSNLYNTNQFALQSKVVINYNPSHDLYVTFIGSPKITNAQGSQSVYPSGVIINQTAYYLNPLYQYTGLDCQG